MNKKLIITVLCASLYLTAIISQGCLSSPRPNNNANLSVQEATLSTTPTPQLPPFPSYADIFGPPSWWKAEHKNDPVKNAIFKLSQAYPEAEPTPEYYSWEEKKFDKIFDRNASHSERGVWKEYLIEVLKYAYEGNLEIDWQVTNRPKEARQWYHAPWLHTAPRGREFVHGLTSERCSCAEEITNAEIGASCGPNPPDFIPVEGGHCPENAPIQNWGIGFFNPRGGYTIGQVWKEMTIHQNDASKFPNPEKFKELDFPNGTVIVKLLFTSASNKEAPFLAGSRIKWRADIWRAKMNRLTDSPQHIPELRLLQIDIAVRDVRADAGTGWVFGTFVYNRNSNLNIQVPSEDKKDWIKFDPVGLMWGNDPELKLDAHRDLLKESLVDKNLTHHLGCGGRLNGSIDNPQMSCLSCHAQAEVDKEFKRINNYNFVNDPCDLKRHNAEQLKERRSYYFRNIKSPGTFSENTFPLHYSLQLRAGIARFCQDNPVLCKGEEKKLLSNERSFQEITRDERFATQ